METETIDKFFLELSQFTQAKTHRELNLLREIDRLRKCEAKLSAIVDWLEENQEDVFTRGLWEAINNATN